jgi:hypothetical protein
MIGFIDDYRGAYGVEPICRVLKIAPSTYHAHDARDAALTTSRFTVPARSGVSWCERAKIWPAARWPG